LRSHRQKKARRPRAQVALDFRGSGVIIVVTEGDVGALGGEGPDDGCADAPAAASDQGHAAIELACPSHQAELAASASLSAASK
jgi:hypothetical protein